MQTRKLSGHAALLMGALLGSAAYAADPAQIEEAPIVAEEVGARYYGVLFGGGAFAPDYKEEFSDGYTFEHDLSSGWLVGAALGARINPFLRAEVEASHLSFDVGEVTGFLPDGSFDFDDDETSGDVSATFLLANVWVDVPVGDMPVAPYVGGGIGGAYVNPDWSFDFDGFGVDEGGWGFAWQAGGGVRWFFNPNWGVDLGYRFKQVIDASVRSTGDDGMDANLSVHTVQLGIVGQF